MNKELWLQNIEGYMKYVVERSEDTYEKLIKSISVRLVPGDDGSTGIGFSFGGNSQHEDVVRSPEGFTESDLQTVVSVITELQNA